MTEGKDVFTEDEAKKMFGEAFDQVGFKLRVGLAGLMLRF
jgi:hypothetical protein